MPNILEQQPSFDVLPAGQDIIFVVSNINIVAQHLKVKFIAEVHISSAAPPNLSTATDLVGTFKTTPNNKGVGIFDLSSVVENYVKADNMAIFAAEYKGVMADDLPFPMHMIDKYSNNNHSTRYLAIQFKIEYLGGDPNNPDVVDIASGQAVNTPSFTVFNGYLKDNQYLEYSGNTNQNFGWDWRKYYLLSATWSKFLTNAPTTQSANIEDYGTLAFLYPRLQSSSYEMDRIDIRYYDSDGSYLTAETVMRTWNNGAFNGYGGYAPYNLLFFGCYPGNLQNWSATFQGLVAAETIQGGHYTVQALNAGDEVSEEITINVTCPDLKNYEPIRLTWLNQFGAWDYFTFNKKSTRSISTKGSTYNQLAGTWNSLTYRADSYKGGKKSFRVNATEKIKMNTDFVSEEYNTMFEELINSPEIYVLEGFHEDNAVDLLNTYVTPVRLTTSNFTRKTKANDRLIQYTFEVEKSKILRTQSI